MQQISPDVRVMLFGAQGRHVEGRTNMPVSRLGSFDFLWTLLPDSKVLGSSPANLTHSRWMKCDDNRGTLNVKAPSFEQSMSRKGNCWDNSPTERFFRSLKYEQLNYEKFRAKASAKLSIFDYLAFYNGERSYSKLGYQSQLHFERAFYKPLPKEVSGLY
jgi:hypothetical protein